MKLNLGCGLAKIEGCVNIDVDPSVQPDLVHNFAEVRLPYGSGSVEEVYMFHTIEHIPREKHPLTLGEINRVLKKDGLFFVSYPDAEIVLKNALSNHKGEREFWEKAIFGRALSIWDVHRCLIFTPDFVAILNEFGFYRFKWTTEVNQDHNTIIQCAKNFKVLERSELVRRETYAVC